MVDVGVVQSGYNDPAAALIITDLLDRIDAPTREERSTTHSQVCLAAMLAGSNTIRSLNWLT